MAKTFEWKTTPQGSLVSPFFWRIYDGVFTGIYKQGLLKLVSESGVVVEADHVSYADDHLTILTIRVSVEVDDGRIGKVIGKFAAIARKMLTVATELVGCGVNPDKSECVVSTRYIPHVKTRDTKDHFK